MNRWKCIVAYDGTSFAGYQVQPNKRTVQGEIEKVLEKIHKGKHVPIFASGRTDAGVHAKGQVIHFDSPLSIPDRKWPVALNSLLPEEISVLHVEKVSTKFHARFSAIEKEYRYFVYTDDVRSPFYRNYAHYYPFPLNVERMREAALHLIGVHDFTSFCSAKTEIEDKVRHLKEMEIKEVENQMIFRFVGNGFLYNMVRILVGTLLQVGKGELTPNDVREILLKKDRTVAGKTAPPQGLYLWKVSYEDE